MVVDDDEGVLNAYEEILAGSTHQIETTALMQLLSEDRDEGSDGTQPSQPFKIVKASSAEEAIDCFREAFDADEPISTVFLDVRMPPGMTGVECGVRLRAIDPSVYLVIATAYADYSTAELREALGMDFVYLKKPFVPEELSQIAELFSLYRQREQEREAESRVLKDRAG